MLNEIFAGGTRLAGLEESIAHRHIRHRSLLLVQNLDTNPSKIHNSNSKIHTNTQLTPQTPNRSLCTGNSDRPSGSQTLRLHKEGSILRKVSIHPNQLRMGMVKLHHMATIQTLLPHKDTATGVRYHLLANTMVEVPTSSHDWHSLPMRVTKRVSRLNLQPTE